MHDTPTTFASKPDGNCPRPPPRIDVGYLSKGRDQVYSICLTPPGEVVGNVVHAGPFAFERSATYVHCQKWVDVLLLSGFRVMRFDYRGHGESTGRFEDFGPREWSEDLQLCAASMREKHPNEPLLLHGLRIGSLLAYDAFQRGTGDGLLMWSPPVSAREMLYGLLRLRIATDFALPADQRRSRDDYVADMERGQAVEVDCYPWSKQLWEGAVGFERPQGDHGTLPGPDGTTRPWMAMDLNRVDNNPGLAFDPMTWKRVQFRSPDFSELFRLSADWLQETAKDLRCAKPSNTN